MDRVDDLYFNRYDGNRPWMAVWDSSIAFLVDGDHTGGPFSYLLGPMCQTCTPVQVLEDNRQAQQWVAIAEAPSRYDDVSAVGPSSWARIKAALE